MTQSPPEPLAAQPADREQSLQEELLEEMFSPADDLDETESPETEPVAEQAADEPAEPEPDRFLTQRSELQRRLTGSTRLPPALRERLSGLIEQAAWNDAGEEQPALSISQAAAWLEEVLPRQFSLDPAALSAREHPAGDTFFSGQTGGPSDQQAAQLAAEQLAATGFAPQGP